MMVEGVLEVIEKVLLSPSGDSRGPFMWWV